MGRKKSELRKSLQNTNLIEEMQRSSLTEIAFKFNTSVTIIQSELTNQLRVKPRVDPSGASDGSEEIMLKGNGFGQWMNSPERATVKEYQEKVLNFERLSNLF